NAMLIKIKRGWELPEAAATPESVFVNRRALLKTLGLGAIAAGLPAARSARADAVTYPFPKNERYTVDRVVTPEDSNVTYTNFTECGSQTPISKAAQRLTTKPWTLTIDGMVEQPITIDAEALLAQMPREERVYRHRCVEAWSMVVPWSGFGLA